MPSHVFLDINQIQDEMVDSKFILNLLARRQIISNSQHQSIIAMSTTAQDRDYRNRLQTCVAENQVCKSFGIKLSANAQVVQVARHAGFDSLFIDLEHAWLSLAEASNLCNVAHLADITPFVRVPHQCGTGYVQKVLDGGAMGVIFPHVHSAGIAS